MLRRTIFALTTLAASFLLASTSYAEPPPATDGPEAAARKIVDELVATWNAGDGTAHASYFTEDATFRVWNGHASNGRAAIAADHQRIFDTFYAGTELRSEIDRVRPLTEDVALVYLSSRLSRNGEPLQAMPGMKGAVPLLVIQRTDSGWMVVHFQNTPNLLD